MFIGQDYILINSPNYFCHWGSATRVVVVSSSLMNSGQLDLTSHDHWRTGRQVDPSKRSHAPSGYCDSKLMNALFTRELASRVTGKGVGAVCVCPGWCYTDLARHTGINIWKKILLAPIAFMFMRSARQGAANIIHAVMEEEDKLVPGGFYRDKKVTEAEAGKLAGLTEVQTRLWQESEQLTETQWTGEVSFSIQNYGLCMSANRLFKGRKWDAHGSSDETGIRWGKHFRGIRKFSLWSMNMMLSSDCENYCEVWPSEEGRKLPCKFLIGIRRDWWREHIQRNSETRREGSDILEPCLSRPWHKSHFFCRYLRVNAREKGWEEKENDEVKSWAGHRLTVEVCTFEKHPNGNNIIAKPTNLRLWYSLSYADILPW